MSDQVRIGTCSICGGDVMAWTALMIVGPFPPPSCRQCGATARKPGPVIPMEPRKSLPRVSDGSYTEAPPENLWGRWTA